MRLLLDEQLSYRWIGQRLTDDGHDVLSFSVVPSLEGMDDLSLLLFASREQRILISANGKHFVEYARALLSEGVDNSGLILLPSSINTDDYGTILRGIRSVVETYGSENWENRIVWITR